MAAAARWAHPAGAWSARARSPGAQGVAGAILAAAPGDGHLRSFQFPVLFRFVAGEFRADDACVHVFRAAERHPQEPHAHGAGVDVPLFSDAAAGLRTDSVLRAYGG